MRFRTRSTFSCVYTHRLPQERVTAFPQQKRGVTRLAEHEHEELREVARLAPEHEMGQQDVPQAGTERAEDAERHFHEPAFILGAMRRSRKAAGAK